MQKVGTYTNQSEDHSSTTALQVQKTMMSLERGKDYQTATHRALWRRYSSSCIAETLPYSRYYFQLIREINTIQTYIFTTSYMYCYHQQSVGGTQTGSCEITIKSHSLPDNPLFCSKPQEHSMFIQAQTKLQQMELDEEWI